MTINKQHSPLHYAVTGKGPLVILLHGLLMDGNSWVTNGLVEALSSDFTVVYPDLPAHGKSAKHVNIACDRQSQADIIRDLIDEMGFKKAHIVGYSSGAWLAIGLIKYHPELISSVVIGGWDVQNGLPKGPEGRLDFDTFFAFAQATAPDLTRWVMAENIPPLRSYFEALAAYDGQQDAPLVSNINVPKMFWAGDRDIYYPPLKTWAENNNHPFISAPGDHVKAVSDPASVIVGSVYDFLKGSYTH